MKKMQTLFTYVNKVISLKASTYTQVYEAEQNLGYTRRNLSLELKRGHDVYKCIIERKECLFTLVQRRRREDSFNT